ncbi:energy transducer TonB [Novosphingobium sp.]|uniref:energy transducer TonB family protein n=1 Tax=Novosphingobium sp. TaxID=1874826 RepID=UPI0028B176EC|nr:energy transducer TonB [Novosphingobium sp.]
MSVNARDLTRLLLNEHSSLGRSSGSIFLDRAALETIRRAQPLPAIPEGKPDELELSVPVEFFLQ